ncbi:ribose-5-phosphate isomerase RpiA [Enterococcus dongliensis]|uniref:Ribose-5-phosphate isomerase A n=1 Tax=Enterococcus dongliensis TaxID=2559925 RepID=A0AAP5NJQ9_9ENTE|nr:ribose-5-phosphate isomerase RpiA [Enterococcus dongliensis]MDT2596119.1 ribose-5-phosphate isomerase RpiA [Enterococcus dongliensis]MDT2603839.1 ribose-5-phosphate isomerase RpiA [Enterococcus dongliensis]MDT2612827.1 ribose-5-phosphate isomerase RpiA [Enterococcus dongliensis]MDT2634264.1 ribose-5-phosphate isomerase RpiA [Enterococcus dongliensis]MDT2637194.1 ribose-5-phosphate isomerase RpiA [Enterococcus dongliensis]
MNLKELVGIEAAKFVKDGMTVGLGTGSTAYYLVKELGRRVNEEGLKITGVVTSSKTEEQAKELGIPLKAIDEVDSVDLTIDGADEISADFQGIKGGGAALLFEKVVATYSKDCIWIVDESKMVDKLGKFPLPVEVVPFGGHNLFRLFEAKGYRPTWRKTEADELLTTDGGHYIIDLHLEVIEDPRALAKELDDYVGVVEHGLFIDMISRAIVGTPEGPKILEVPAK